MCVLRRVIDRRQIPSQGLRERAKLVPITPADPVVARLGCRVVERPRRDRDRGGSGRARDRTNEQGGHNGRIRTREADVHDAGFPRGLGAKTNAGKTPRYQRSEKSRHAPSRSDHENHEVVARLNPCRDIPDGSFPSVGSPGEAMARWKRGLEPSNTLQYRWGIAPTSPCS